MGCVQENIAVRVQYMHVHQYHDQSESACLHHGVLTP